jgi:hypothetical protein
MFFSWFFGLFAVFVIVYFTVLLLQWMSRSNR